MGVLYGDGNVFRGPSYSRVSASGSHSTTHRWIALIAPFKEPKEFKSSPGTYQAYIDSVDLVEWFEGHMGICGPKHDNLEWPKGLPHKLKVHFLRGVWDSDGSLFIERRRHKRAKGNDSPGAKVGMNAEGFIYRVRSELEKLVGVERVKVSKDGKMREIKYHGAPAMRVADFLYADAPEHLRNEDRIEAYRELCKLRDSLEAISCLCGKPVEREGLCTACWYARRPYKTGPSTVCLCGKSPVLAKGMCSACYSQARRSSPSYRRLSSGVCLCGSPAFRKGMCDRCYSAERRAAASTAS